MHRPYSLNIPLSLALAVAFSHCSETILDNASPVIGSWTEAFVWIDGHGTEAPKTTTITFNQEQFSVSILPPHRELASVGGTIVVRNSPDTLHTGHYTFDAGTLRLATASEFEDFDFTISGDTLRLGQHVEFDSSGIGYFSTKSFVWGHAEMKTRGTFIRR